MAKQLNVNLAFNADITQAKKSIEELNQSLRKIQTQPTRMFNDADLAKASRAAQDLEKHLRAAVNVDTGKLDLNKFSQSLSSSKQNLGDLYNDLSKAGKEGQTAFLQMAKSINEADSSTINLGSKLKELTTTLKNTARWEISSKIMHGFESAISSAYGYAQDLNKSLNDIRIVTGANSEEMAKFAESANRAAKLLSTTTTDYTNASLIYFQQGLSDQEVAERTEVTIKMANAAGVSAEKVSDQMTAVWNNFDNGSKSLEYYADVMTALGAATASSTDEISQGLNKFAAVAETVGLSYEYATAALATVTSETRESADVVGTAYKTLFARIQGLQQGDTLDDGTTLNKYSAALAKVGINIKDTNGDMKQMDTILDELGSKWGTLAKDQQLALAQTVAGVRQYNQLIALMDNWGTFQENLTTAYNSEGTLQEQADIYAESWEAASKRVEAAAQGIYEELLNDDFFIDVLDGFEKFLTGINNVIDGMGGLKGILLSVGGIFLRNYAKEIPQALRTLGDNFDVITGKAEKNRQKILQENKLQLFSQKTGFMNEGQKRELETMQKVSAMTVELEKNRKNLSNTEIQEYENKIKLVKLYGQSAVALAEESKEIQDQLKLKQKSAISQIMSKTDSSKDLADTNKKLMQLEAEKEKATELKDQLEIQKKIDKLEEEKKEKRKNYIGEKKNTTNIVENYSKTTKEQAKLIEIQESLQKTAMDWSEQTKDLKENSEEIKKYDKVIEDYLKTIKEAGLQDIEINLEDFKKLTTNLQEVGNNAEEADAVFKKWSQEMGLSTKIEDLDISLEDLETTLRVLKVPENLIMEIKELATASGQIGLEQIEMNERLRKAGQENINHTMELSEAYGVMASTLMEVWSAINSVKQLGSIWQDDDLTTGEKIFQTMSAMIPVAISLTSVLGKQSRNQLGSAAAAISHALGLKTEAVASTMAAAATNTLNVSLGTLWSLLWPIALIIGGLVATVWVLVEAFKAIEKASPEGQLKAAKEEAKELNSALDEAREAAEDLKAAFDNYDEAVQNLEDCTKGTQEWRDALREVNNEVLNLLSEYPQLASMTNEAGEKAIDYGENGEMIVQDWAKEELLNKANTSITNTKTASVLANQNVREAQIKVDESDFAKLLNKQSKTSGYKYNEDGTTGDASGQISSYITSNASKLSNMTQEDQRAMLTEYFKNQGITADAQAWVDAIAEIGPQFGKLTKAIEQNTAATKLENETIASSILSSNEAIQESDYANQITKVVAEGLDKEIDAKIEDLKNKKWGTEGISEATGVNDEVREIFRQYAEVAGINNYDLLDTTGTDKNRNFVYRDSDGQEITVSLEAMRRVMASAQVNAELAENANSLLETMNRVGEASAAAITAAVTKDVNNLTVGQLDYSEADIQAVADSLTIEELNKMGFESAEAFIDAFNETVSNGEESWQDIANDYTKSIEASLKDLKKSGALEEFTLSEADSLGKLLQQTFNKGGKEGLGTLESMLKKVRDDSDEFAMILGGLDWNTITIEELIPLLEEAGIECDGLESALEHLINLMSDGAMTLGKATEVYASLHKIIDDLEEGDTVTDEEYKTLLEMVGDDVNSYFMQMADGSHKLIGDAEDFYKLVNGFTLDNFDKTVDELNSQKNKIDTLISGGEESITGSSYSTNGRISISDRRANAFNNSQVSIDEDKLQQQLNYLETIGYDENQMAEWRQGIEDKDLSIKDLSEINKAVKNNIGSWDKLSESQKQVDEDLKNAREAIASSATTIDELNVKLNEGRIEQEDFDKALKSVFKTQIEKEGLDVKQAEYYAKSAESMGYTVEEAYRLAIVQTKLSRGFDSLSSNWKKWTDVMTDSNAIIDEIAEIMPDINKSLSDIMNWDLSDVESLPADFVKNNWPIIQDIYNGVDGAIEKLTGLAAKSFIVNLDMDTSEVQTEYQTIMNWLDNMPDYEIGMTLDSTEMTDAFNALLETGLITVDQMNDILSKIGFTPEIKYKDVEITDSHTQSITSNGGFTRLDENGNEEWVPISNESEVSAHIGTSMRIPYIDGENTIYSGGGGVEIEAPKDRTGGKSKKPKRTHQSETVERYKEVTDKIDDTTDAIEDARRAADGLWGPARIKKMREVQNEMKKEIGLLREKKVEAERYLAQDQANLQAEANRLGIGAQFSFNSNGNIANYTTIMNQLHEQLRAAESAAGADPTETQQKALDDIEYKINEIKKIIGIYDETRETLEDIDNEIEDKILELQQEKFDEINLELEVDLVVNETHLKDIEYELGKLEDNFFGMAEALALMSEGQFERYKSNIAAYEENLEALNRSYEAGEINQAQYVESLQNVQDGLYENLNSIQDLNKEMIHYYGDVLAAASEELEKFTSLMDHHVEVLDHYASLMELLGRSKDWDDMLEIFSTQVKVSENAAIVSKKNYELFQQEAEAKKMAWEALGKGLDADNLTVEEQIIKQQWLDAQNAANEAQKKMLEDAQTWAEAHKALLEAELTKLADELKKNLSTDGFLDLDHMIESMERASSLQEEYLTTTNQIYETNKLMRQAQQEIDKSTNSVAKRRLKQFIDETNSMQEQNKLSQFELDIQKAKYDLLLAEIALEEAQQAKSTVRLQRDAEGNFGYVYTADQNEVAQAQQDLEDAQNALYNIGLEGANKYSESYAQTLQRMNDDITTLTQAWVNGEIASKEEYQRRMLELEEYYGKELMKYSEFRTIALGTDSRVMTDAWSTSFGNMTLQTQNWMNQVNTYVTSVETKMGEYQQGLDNVEAHIGLKLENITDKTSEITIASNNLTEAITKDGGLIDAFKVQMDSVSQLTAKYTGLAEEMERIEGLAKSISQTIENEANSEGNNASAFENFNSNSGKSAESGVDGKNGKIDVGDSVTYTGGTYFSSSAGDGPTGRRGVGGTVTVTDVREGSPYPIHVTSSNSAFGWLRKDQLAGYDTGGYTGNWEGSYGKLALLHKKELILNEGDTENFLTGMDVLNKIISTIDLYSLNAQLGGLLSTPSYGGFGDTDTIEQNVHIEANFPNVSDHNEIEEALSTLINRASQFASRK